MKADIAIVGSGSWGTALACALSDGARITLCARTQKKAEELSHQRVNLPYLPNVKIPPSVAMTADLPSLLQSSPRVVILAIPSRHLSFYIPFILPNLLPSTLLVSAIKGIEETTQKTMSTFLREQLKGYPPDQIAVLSGPTFAGELVRHQPSGADIAAPRSDVAGELQQLLSRPYFRLHTTTDVIGVEMGGALKNVAALATGICEGLGFGHNAKAVLVTLALSEMQRLGTKLGALSSTFLGLSGLGDLVLTCYGHASRNLQTGIRLGRGEKLSAILPEYEYTVEGVFTLRATHTLMRHLSLPMPLVDAVYQILYGGKEPKTAMVSLFENFT